MDSPLLLCTDLDRTLIANGAQEESPDARVLFDALVSLPEITLVYVTGRHLELIQEAMREYQLPCPEFIIADVGTSIYHQDSEGEWISLNFWQAEIARDWGSLQSADLHQILKDLAALRLQEQSKQNRYKLSYYFSTDVEADALASEARKRLADARVKARVIYGFDEMRGIGLLDVLPERASKLQALQALMDMHNLSAENVVFSGDSGNDLDVLVSGVPAVLVANASPQIKAQARKLATQAGNGKLLYIAEGGFLGMNGCYSAGILEGIAHYHPHMIDWIELPLKTASAPSGSR